MPVLTILKTTDEKAKKKKQRNSKTKFFKSVLSSLNESDRSTERARSALLRRRGGEGLRREECGVGSPLSIQNMYRWRGRDGLEKTDVLSTARRFDFFVNLFFLKKHVHLFIRREGGGGNGYICQAGNVGPQDN